MGPTSSDTWRRERVKRPSRRISLSQSPLSRPHHARSSVWLVTLIPQEDSELSLPSGLKTSQLTSSEDSTRTTMSPRSTLSKTTPRNILRPRTPRNTSTEISKESESTALSLESLLPLKLRNASLERRRLTSWKSKLTVVTSPLRSTGLSPNSKEKSPSVKFSKTMRWLILSPSPEVKVPKVSSRDSVSPDFQERLEEVSERSLVLVPGIHLQSSGLSPELVISVTSIELTLTPRSTESVKVPLEVSTTTLLPKLMLTPRTSPQSVDSHITVLLTRISSLLRVESADQERDKSPSERLFSHKLAPSLTSSSRLNLSIPLPRSVTVNSRPQRRKTSSSDHLPPSKRSDLKITNKIYDPIKL